jgi:hypothetical protein
VRTPEGKLHGAALAQAQDGGYAPAVVVPRLGALPRENQAQVLGGSAA